MLKLGYQCGVHNRLISPMITMSQQYGPKLSRDDVVINNIHTRARAYIHVTCAARQGVFYSFIEYSQILLRGSLRPSGRMKPLPDRQT